MYLDSKFQMSYELFEIEVSKILYIRDNYKDVAFNTIKTRADMKNPKHYILAEDILDDLNNMFGDYDKISKANAELDSPKFAIGSKDSKETFDAFYARFIAAITPLSMSEREKSSRLRKLVTSRLKYRIVDFPITTSFRDLVTRLRQVDIALRLTDDQNPRGNRGEGSSGSNNNRGGRGGSSTRRGRGGSNNNNNLGSNSGTRANNSFSRGGKSGY